MLASIAFIDRLSALDQSAIAETWRQSIIDLMVAHNLQANGTQACVIRMLVQHSTVAQRL